MIDSSASPQNDSVVILKNDSVVILNVVKDLKRLYYGIIQE